MKVPVKWLSEFVAPDRAIPELAHLITMAGLEVEAVTRIGEVAPEFVTARILEQRPHPNADRLTLCTVQGPTALDTAGTRESNGPALQVVCGARNMKPGDVVVLALPGATLPGGKRIERTKLRGELSEGMLCSARELEISTGHEGLLILPPDTPVGVPFSEVFSGADTVLDINVTPNRPDCLSILGVARDVAALTGATLCPPPPVKIAGRAENVPAKLNVDAPDLCPTYLGRVIDGVKIGPSPDWVVSRLVAAGLRSINNVVDATNYVMLERGQPVHAFDLDRLAGQHIIVRRGRPGEKLVTLDNAERTLGERDLLICDEAGPVAIGGVMGGAASAVSMGTRRLLLEAAWFLPESVRATARRTGLHSDASQRFERGVDPEGTRAAMDALTDLIMKVAGGEVVGGLLEAIAPRPPRPSILMKPERVNALLGLSVPAERMKRHLEALRMTVTPVYGGFDVVPPSYRLDVEQEADLAEEVARLEGYENLPTTRPVAELQAPSPGPGRKLVRALVAYLSSHGLDQVINYAFLAPALIDALRLEPTDPRSQPIRLVNPLTEELSVMRTLLLPSLLKAAVHNERHQNPDLRIFEVSKAFVSIPGETRPSEQLRLGCLLMGRREARGWTGAQGAVDIFDLKGVLEGVSAHFRLSDVRLTDDCKEPFLLPGQAWTVRSGESEVGFFGALHPETARSVGLESQAYVLELDLKAYLSAPRREVRAVPLPRFPSVSRDLAVVVDERVSADALTGAVRGAAGPLLETVSLFDVFRGKGIDVGSRSVAFGLVYRASDRTLVESEVQASYDRVLEVLASQFGARLRG